MSEAVEYGYIGLNGSWVDPETARENKRQQAMAEKQRAAAEAELEAERAEQARLADEERAAEIEEALRPPTADQIAELAALKGSDPELYDDEVAKIGERQAEVWPVPLADNIEGCGRARGMLISFRELIDRTDAELQGMRATRSAFLVDVGAPGDTEAQINDLVESDTDNFLSWLRSAGKIGSTEVRSFERARLETKLPADRHKREVALAALGRLEVEIDLVASRAHYLREQLPGYIADALLEAVGPRLAREYVERIKDLEATTASMLGLAKVARNSAEAADGFSPFGYFVGPTFEVVLPRFTLEGLPERPAIQADDAKVAAAAVPWAELADLWGHNPRADLPEVK